MRATATWVWAFTAYAYAATTISAAWFARQAVASNGGEMGLGQSLRWQGSAYMPWLGVAGLVWAVIRVFGPGLRGAGALLAAGVAVVPAMSLLTVWIDTQFVSGSGDLVARAMVRAPVAILLYTAVCAVGLAAAHRSRAVAERERAAALEADLDAALASARDGVAAEPAERLMVMTGSRRAPVLLAEVEWFAAAGNYVVVHWADREGLIREPLKSVEARLNPAVFARSHRSTVVNLARVREARSLSDGSWRLTMHSGAELVASRTHRDDILSRLGR